ncbi:hypothetical protein CANARDRAFT_27782 [[Candida] arabinofermentans NRRL YB-2248]|uniref:Ribosomal protein L17 n=1 Tax=[Candida] arabinofermentans NRRL YB-2248 TaxID=983967 RepID=A0A1E4T1P5_9ASCO|nr:hypothetical protein CANARDRAFT_27782 [[Candida] arabinofermentans NRRL YB-2248]
MTLGRSAKALRHTMRNLASSLIQYESVTTTFAKAKMVQGLVENLITKTKNADLKSSEVEKLLKIKLVGELYNQDITVPKMMNELRDRYSKRQGGYTRIIKLEPRIGDNAPQAIVELVDSSSREMKFWYIARVVARLELQGLPLDQLTKKNVESLLHHRVDGAKKFRDAVELSKKRWYMNENGKVIKERLENLPRMKNDTTKSGFHKEFTNYTVVPRPNKST